MPFWGGNKEELKQMRRDAERERNQLQEVLGIAQQRYEEQSKLYEAERAKTVRLEQSNARLVRQYNLIRQPDDHGDELENSLLEYEKRIHDLEQTIDKMKFDFGGKQEFLKTQLEDANAVIADRDHTIQTLQQKAVDDDVTSFLQRRVLQLEEENASYEKTLRDGLAGELEKRTANERQKLQEAIEKTEQERETSAELIEQMTKQMEEDIKRQKDENEAVIQTIRAQAKEDAEKEIEKIRLDAEKRIDDMTMHETAKWINQVKQTQMELSQEKKQRKMIEAELQRKLQTKEYQMSAQESELRRQLKQTEEMTKKISTNAAVLAEKSSAEMRDARKEIERLRGLQCRGVNQVSCQKCRHHKQKPSVRKVHEPVKVVKRAVRQPDGSFKKYEAHYHFDPEAKPQVVYNGDSQTWHF